MGHVCSVFFVVLTKIVPSTSVAFFQLRSHVPLAWRGIACNRFVRQLEHDLCEDATFVATLVGHLLSVSTSYLGSALRDIFIVLVLSVLCGVAALLRRQNTNLRCLLFAITQAGSGQQSLRRNTT